jgi:hypothetical protein
MHLDFRRGLLQLQTKLDQLIADVEDLTGAECVDDTLQGATKAMAELRETRAEIEGKSKTE